MQIKKRIIYYLTFMLLAACASSYSYTQYHMHDGLSQSEITGGVEDSRGILWFSSNHGLNRYNGQRFENYYDEDGLLSNAITSLQRGRNDRIYIGTDRGINIIDNDNILPLALNDMPDKYIVNMDLGPKHLWYITQSGIGNFHLQTQKKMYTPLETDRDLTIIKWYKKNVYIGSTKGLFRYNKGKLERILPNLREYVGCMKEFHNRLLLSHHNQLLLFNSEAETTSQLFQFDSHIFIYDIAVEATRLFVSTNDGMFQLTLKGKEIESCQKLDLPIQVCRFIVQDFCNNYWVGSNSGEGLLKLYGSNFENISMKGRSKSSVVWSIYPDSKQRIWIGTDTGLVIHNNTSPKIPIPENPRNLAVRGILENPDYYFLTQGQEFLIYNKQKRAWKFIQPEIEGLVFFREIVYSKDKRNILLCSNKGILKYNIATGILQNILDDHSYHSIHVDKQGNIWFGTWFKGLFMGELQGNTIQIKKHYSLQNMLPSNNIKDIYDDSQDRLWVATDNGIALFSPDRKQCKILGKDYFDSNLTYFVFEDHSGNFWIGTNQGIYGLDKQLKVCEHYTEEDGLVSNETNSRAYGLDNDNYIYIGTITGISKFYYRPHKHTQIAPRIFLRSLYINNKKHSLTDRLIKNGNQQFEFNIEFIHYSNSKKKTIYYRLNPSSKEWKTISHMSTLTISHLPSGKYELEFYGKTKKGIESVHKEYTYEIDSKANGIRTLIGTLILFVLATAGLSIRTLLKGYKKEILNLRTELKKAKDQCHKLEKRHTILSITDPLTKLYNRRQFFKDFRECTYRFGRYQHDFTLIIFQIDEIKEFKKLHGEDAGNQIIRKFTQVLFKSLRHSDKGYRINEYDCSLLLPNTDQDEAKIVAGKILQKFSEIAIQIPKTNEYISCHGAAGVDIMKEDYKINPNQMIMNAEYALFQAKKSADQNVCAYSTAKGGKK